MTKRIVRVLLTLMMCQSLLLVFCWAAEDIVILYTNDVHTYLDNHIEDETGLTYSKIAALKATYENVLLVDAGDHIQGTAYGDLDKGETVLRLMNAAGYDLATLGNHEFDYGQSGRINVTDVWAGFPYVSCNFHHEANGVVGETVLDPYKIFEVNGVKIAFVGITTPETITSSAPSYFQDENGTYLYGIAAGKDGSELYKAVQRAVDAAMAEGADYVIALGHLGDDPSSAPYRSVDVIQSTIGIDVFIDGHSHSTIPMHTLSDKNGDTVILTQTGSYLKHVGKLTIGTNGSLTTQLLQGDVLAHLSPTPEVKAIEDAWIQEVSDLLGEVIGFSEVIFDNYDSQGTRLVRKQSTNTGDFAADAHYYLFDEMGMDVDVAVMNGGGIRNGAITGDLSYLTCKEIHTFGNVACLLNVTGQQLLDALEWGSKGLNHEGSAENGSLLHVSGLRYTLDVSRPSTVQADDKDIWTGPPTGDYRVKDVQVLNNQTGLYEPLDLEARYNLAGYNYTLRDLGGGFAMFSGAVNVLDYVAEDYMVLANYIRSFPVDEVTGLPTITAADGYSDRNGSGRITLACPSASYRDVGSDALYHRAVDFVLSEGLMDGLSNNTFAPNDIADRATFVTALWHLEGEPVVNDLMPFADVPQDQWYTEAVRWAASQGIVNGYSPAVFAPADTLTREQMAAILYRYEQHRGGGFSDAWMFLLNVPDRDQISPWAYEALCWTTMHHIISGRDDGSLDPKGLAARWETAQTLMDYVEQSPDK